MTLVAGCDVGSLTSKAVIMNKGRILGAFMTRSRVKPEMSADDAMAGALKMAQVAMKDISRCVGTGYGREKIPFVNDVVSEIACHGKGARWLVSSARTIIDIGGQDCKAMHIDDAGRVVKFITNDKCASGTGRFLDVMARVLGVSVDELGRFSARAKEPVTLASTCTVWAQADVIKYLNSGVPIEDIGAGINTAMASRIAILANSVRAEGDVCMTGGVAKNAGVVQTLEKLIGHRVKVPRKADPQLAGAIGAAIVAMENYE
ncbi:MAG: acyl-CoA dehydratase activase [Thermodesulfobacteriota bacterium]